MEIALIVFILLVGIGAVNVDYSSEVKQGEVLARIEPSSFETRVREEEAAVAVAKATAEGVKVGDLSDSSAIGPVASKVQFDKGQGPAAQASLGWVAEHASEDEYRAIARLRLAALLLDEKKYDEALKQLGAAVPKSFEALMADRRGDVLHAQGKDDEAVKAYKQAWDALAATDDYRRLVDAKLTALGAAPGQSLAELAAAAASGAPAPRGRTR